MRYRRGRRKVFMLDKCWWETTRDWLLFINTDLYIFDCDPTMLQNTAWGRTEKYPSMNCLFKKVIVLSFIRLKCLTFPCFVMERCTTFGSSKISTMTFWLTLWSVEIHSVTWRIFIFWFVIGIGLALISKVCRRILFEYYYYFKYNILISQHYETLDFTFSDPSLSTGQSRWFGFKQNADHLDHFLNLIQKNLFSCSCVNSNYNSNAQSLQHTANNMIIRIKNAWKIFHYVNSGSVGH